MDGWILNSFTTGAHHFTGEPAGHCQKGTKRSHDYTTFTYQSHNICLKTFLFLHYIGKNISKKCGIMHGNTKRRPWNVSTFHDKERAGTFIKNFAEVHAISLPGRMPKLYDFCYQQMHLKHLFTETALKVLEESLEQPVRCYGYREFC